MRRIIKDDEPDFWKSFKRKNPRIIYKQLEDSDEGKQVRSDIKQHMIKHQKYLCAYCCRSIDFNDSHNEHIKPEKIYNTLTMDYNNLVASCTNESESCGMYKGHNYNEKLFVSPLHEDCEIHFEFMPDGTILGKTPAGKYTVDALNLNCYALKSSRECLYNQCIEMADLVNEEYIREEYIDEKDGKLPRFVDMVSYFYNLGFFSIESRLEALEMSE